MFANHFFRLEEPGMNLTIRAQPIFEDEDQAKQAMDDMANQLRMVGFMHKILCYRTLLMIPCSELSRVVSDEMLEPCVAVAMSVTRSLFLHLHQEMISLPYHQPWIRLHQPLHLCQQSMLPRLARLQTTMPCLTRPQFARLILCIVPRALSCIPTFTSQV